MDIEADDPTFDAKIKVLSEQVEHHVGEEEKDLFPKVKKILSSEELDILAQNMTAEQTELEEQGEPRDAIPGETGEAATLT
jgi:hypothetical protein